MMGIINEIVIIGLCVYMISAGSSTPINSDNNDTTSNDECSTIACFSTRLRSAYSMRLYMNENVSPCDNFYDYACGNYDEAVNIDESKSYVFLEKSNEVLVTELLYDSIGKIDKTTETSRPRKLVKEYYDLCMHYLIKRDQTPKSLSEIIEKLHGSPLMENSTWNEENWRWEDVYTEAIKLGVPTDIFLLHIDIPNLDNPLSLRLYNPQKAGIGNFKLIRDSRFQDEYKLDKNRLEHQLQELVDFEKNLSNMKFGGPPIETKARFVRQNFLNIDWDKLLDFSIYGVEYDEKSEMMTLESIEYLNYVNSISIPKRVLANYQIVKFLQYASPYLYPDLSEWGYDWKECVESIRKTLPYIADAIVIEDHFDEVIKTGVLEMIANIKEQFKKAINSISWLNESARDFAIEKLEATQYSIAYPDEILDNGVLDEFYKDYEVVKGDMLKTALRFNFLSQKRKMLHYKSSNYTSFERLSSWLDYKISNEVHHNIIRITAGFLLDQNYNKYKPMYMNYATLGRKIAHEISRTLDRDGIFFNKDGNFESLRKNGINDAVFEEYNKKMRCLADQYSGYKYPKIDEPMNGNTTNSENMADVIGIRAAYYAYQEWVKNHGPEPSLPYGEFTPNQLFWMSFAHSQCTVYKDSTDILIGDHPTNDIRVIGSVSNSPEFATDFNCPIDSTMNPTNKCIF